MFNYLYIDLNSFFASCEQQERPELRGRPVAVVPMLTDSTCAIAASYQARRHGIKTGTNVGEARRLCPNLALVQARPKIYVQYHQRIVGAVERCAPVERVLSIDEMVCRLTGDQRHPETALALARQVKRAILKDAGECLTASAGLAPNAFLAKVATDMQKPDGLVAIREEELPQRLFSLQLRDLCGIGPRMEKRLHRHGIFTMEQLCSLSAGRMRAIWGGIGGLKFHMQLRGADIPFTETQTKSMSHQHVLEPALRTREGGLEVARRLLVKGAERMRGEGFYCRRLSINAKLAHHMGYFDDGCDFTETQDTAFLLARLNELWQGFPPSPPWRVGIVLSGLVPATAHQLDIFAPRRKEELMQAVDALNRRYGRGTVAFGLSKTLGRKLDGDKIAFQRVPEEYETK